MIGHDDAVAPVAAAQHLRGEAGVTGASALDLGPDLLDRLEAEVGAEAAGQLGGDHPVGAGGAGRRDLLGDGLTRPSMLVVRAVDLGGPAAGEHDVGLCGGGR